MASREHLRFERLLDKLYGGMEGRIGRVQHYFMNERPPGQEKAPEEVQLEGYLKVRNDPQAWLGIIEQKGVKNAIKYEEFGSRLLTRWQKKAFKSVGSEMPAELAQKKQNVALMQAITQSVQMAMAAQQNPQSALPPEMQGMQQPPQGQAPM